MDHFDRFAEEHGITVKVDEVKHNPYMDDEWSRTASHYRVTLKHGEKSMTFPYSKGSALSHGVTEGEALAAIYNDAGSVLMWERDGDWKSWAFDLGFEWDEACESMSAARAADYGYDCTAYHKAKKAWAASWKMLDNAKRVLGESIFTDLMALDAP